MNWIEYSALRSVRAVLYAMPLSMASAFMGWCWQTFAPLNPRHKRALKHVEMAFGDQYTPVERRKIVSESWNNLGRTFAEGLLLDKLINERHRIEWCSPDLRERWLSIKDGSLVLPHHFGNWELASVPPLDFPDRKLAGVYRRVKNPLVEKFLHDMRAPTFPGGLFPAQAGTAVQAVRHARNGGDLGIVSDLRDRAGIPVRVFGHTSVVTPFPLTLARRFDSPVFAVQIRRKEGCTFVLDAVEIPLDQTDDKERDIADATQRLHSQYEAWVRETPGQWMWAHNRWA